MIELSVRKKYFDAIWIGQKTVECRLNSEKFKDFKPGMIINFTVVDTNKIAVCTIETINVYPDFKSMLIAEGIEKALPGVTDLAEGVKIYHAFPDYKKKVKKMGAIAIRFSLCSYAQIKKLSQEQE